MPKTDRVPALRTHVRKGKGGRVYVYYAYDMRPDGKPDVQLGKDRELALAKWEELHLKKPRVRGLIREAIQDWLEQVLPTYSNAGTRRNYKANLAQIDKVFGEAVWEDITLIVLKTYLKDRRNKADKTKKAGTTANREIAAFQIVWNWARQTAPEGRRRGLHHPALAGRRHGAQPLEEPRAGARVRSHRRPVRRGVRRGLAAAAGHDGPVVCDRHAPDRLHQGRAAG
jgi:hypothetical protein